MGFAARLAYNVRMLRRFVLPFALALLLGTAVAQSSSKPADQSDSTQSQQAPDDLGNAPVPRSDNPQEQQVPPGYDSSSKSNIGDITPPANDTKDHPESTTMNDEVGEFSAWNPMRALKDVEVGDFYAKKGNYAAAESRYREALKFKPHDAVATMRLADTLEKLKRPQEAINFYQDYLRILPNGPDSGKAREGLQRLGGAIPTAQGNAAQPQQSASSDAKHKRSLKKHLKQHFSSWCVQGHCNHPKPDKGDEDPSAESNQKPAKPSASPSE
jgi:tetratricopeptide (TPR) repeat protein